MIVAFRISIMANGGAERVFLSVAEKLASMYGVTIHFVVDNAIKGETQRVVTEKGFSVIDLKCSRTLQTILPLKQYIEQYHPDIILSAFTDTNMAALISAKLAKYSCKIVVSEHASLKEHWQYKSWQRRLLLNTFVRLGYRLADHVLCVSKGIQNQLIDMGLPPKLVSYIHNPVRFNPSSGTHPPEKSQRDEVTLLAVGRIAKAKDYLTLFKAFKLVSHEKKCRLMIVGAIFDGEEKIKLDTFITENSLSESVTFIPFTENIQAYYASADVFVLSSAWEGFGNVIVEALAFGLPVVSTDCNHGPAEILLDNQYGQLVPVGDWQAMAKALIKAISTKDQINKEILKDRSMAFSESTIASQYWTLIQKLINA